MTTDAQIRLAHHEEAAAWKIYRRYCVRARYGNRGYVVKDFDGDATSHELWRNWSAAYERQLMLRRSR
jgi:hypothetical protein